jgi:23S rRNA (uracil1939-C5)-methyltransferase
MEKLLKKGSEIELTIEHLNISGRGVCKVEGCNVAVDGVFPGDKARIVLTKVKKKYAEGRLVEMVSYSPLRIKPRSRHAAISGGSPWEILNYNLQLIFKQQEVERIMKNVGADPEIKQILGMNDPWFYRNKMQYSFGFDENMNPVLGLHVVARKFDVFDLYECLLCEPWIPQLLAFFRNETIKKGIPPYRFRTGEGWLRDLTVRVGKNTKEAMVVSSISSSASLNKMKAIIERAQSHFPRISSWWIEIVSVRKGTITGHGLHHVCGQESIHEKIGDFVFELGPVTFFQPNTEQATKIYQVVRTFIEPNKNQVVYDLFCGSGTIGIFISQNVKSVFGMDIERESIEMAKKNAERNGVKNATFVCGDVFKSQISWPKPDVIIVDPPRSGLSPKLIALIAEWAPSKVIYVSCNIQSFASDIKEFALQGYSLKTLQPVDQFPHTKHLEVVGELTKEK